MDRASRDATVRPLLTGPDPLARIRELMQEREPAYMHFSRLETTGKTTPGGGQDAPGAALMHKIGPHIPGILEAFGLDTQRICQPPDAKLAQVYLVEDRYVLRSRPLEPDTPERFAAECVLCDDVAKLTGFCFPQYEPCKTGACYVMEKNCFWTLHRLIPGRPLGGWFELHRIDPSVNRQVLDTLRLLHTKTAGRFDDKFVDRTRLLQLVSPALLQASGFLKSTVLARLETAFDRVARFCGSYASQEGCFVHGDFHHGNILAHAGRIVGFIDLDWCRVSSPYEDLAFTLMMMLRDYENWSPRLSLARVP